MSPETRDALLVALVLAPATYSRNRFYELYAREPEARRVRRRASMIRSIVRHVASADPQRHGDIIATEPLPDTASGGVSLTYVVPAMGLRRTTVLDAIEIALIRYAIARAAGSALAVDDADRAQIEAAAHGLAGFAIDAAEVTEEHGVADGGP